MNIATTNVIAKIAAVLAGLGLVASSFAFAPAARAATVDELQAQINALLAQISTMQGGSSASGTFTMDLTLGSSGAEVTALQNFLISGGYSIPAGATGYFGAQTQAALAAYQAANGISPASGYFGPITRAKVNGAGGSTGGSSNDDDSDSDLSGGAGSIDEAEFLSSLNNEEVGEDEEDVEVAGLEVTADDGSDIEITAVTLDFDYADTGADDDLDDYADEVSIWLDGEEVARVDAGDFDDDNDYSKTLSLEDGAVIEADDMADLTVALSGVSNLDSTNAGENWNVAIESVRFRDADGATISDTSTGDITDGNDDTTTDAGERQFSFESFATAADVELSVKLTTGDEADAINEAHVIDIDDTDDTDGEEVLAFTIEVEGDSEIMVDDIPVIFTSVETTGDDPDDLVSSATLWYDGEEVGAENFLSSDANGSTETITFDDLALELGEGDHEFIVSVDFVSTADVLDAGDTLKAEITATERGLIDAEDESGEDLVAGDKTGTALGEASEVRESGIMVTLVSTDATVDYGDVTSTNDHDLATFEIVFEVTAFDANMYIDNTDPALTGGGTAHDLNLTGSGTIVDSDIVADDTGIEATNSFLVEEGTTEEFTITVVVTPTADGLFQLDLGSVLYAVTDVDGTVDYTFNLDEFETDSVYLNNDAA
ncbi:MAG: peptidoglycan-binding protein [Patescibacteria group bacterium]